MRVIYYIHCYAAPEQLIYILGSLDKAYPNWQEQFAEVAIFDNSVDAGHIGSYKQICMEKNIRYVGLGSNLGITQGRIAIADDFLETDASAAVIQGDGLVWQSSGYCRCGFLRYHPRFFRDVTDGFLDNGLDYLKLSWTEKHGSGAEFYSWNTLSPEGKNKWYPHTFRGMPPTSIDRIERWGGISVAIGDMAFSNWPSMWSRAFAKGFIKGSPWIPTEADRMRQLFHDQKAKRWRVGCILMSPVEYHHKFDYDRRSRKEV